MSGVGLTAFKDSMVYTDLRRSIQWIATKSGNTAAKASGKPPEEPISDASLESGVNPHTTPTPCISHPILAKPQHTEALKKTRLARSLGKTEHLAELCVQGARGTPWERNPPTWCHQA